MIRPLKLISTLIFVSLQLHAQLDFREGYIITNEEDSIPGLLNYSFNKSFSQSCLFKQSRTGKKVEYTPDQVSAYGFIGDKKFVSRIIKLKTKKQKVFMEQLVSGNMNLLRHAQQFYVERNDSLVKLPGPVNKSVVVDGRQMIRTEKLYVGLLNYQLFDCGLSANNTRYTEVDLTNIIQNFNRCKGGAGLVFKQKLPWTRINVSVFSGVDVSSLYMDDASSMGFKRSVSPIVGVGIDISTPKLFDRLFLSIDPFFTQKKYIGYTESVSGTGTARTDHLINLAQIKVPLGLRYNFKSGAQTPYFKTGLVQKVNLHTDWSILKEYELNGVVTTSHESIAFLKSDQLGFWMSIGFSRMLYGRLQVFAEVRYDKNIDVLGAPSYAPTDKTPSSSNGVNILLGFRL
jgi:hypothetical protein